MPRPGIPPALVPDILTERGKGRSHREIATWLRETHDVRVTHVTVGKLLREHREDRAELTKETVREELGKTLTADIHELEELRRRALAIEQAAMPGVDEHGKPTKGDPGLALKAIEAQRKVIDTKLHYSGAGEPDSDAATSLGDLMAMALKD